MRAVVLAALLMVALPAAARAEDYGGGTAPSGLAGYRDQLTIVRLTPSEDLTEVTLRVWVQARCSAGELKRRVVPLAAGGRFSYAETVRGRLPEDRRVRRIARIAITGRVVAASAGGTVSASIKLRRGGRVVDRCGSGTRAWQARALRYEQTPAPPRANGAYYGLSIQPKRPHAVMLRVSPSGRRVQAFAFNFLLHCRPGRKVWLEKLNVTPGGPVASDGSFALTERYLLRFSDGSERYRVRVGGRFTTAGVKGTLSVTMIARSRTGAVTDRCETGPMGYGALL